MRRPNSLQQACRAAVAILVTLLASPASSAEESSAIAAHVEYEAGPDDQSDHISKLLFLNRCADGCTLQPGYNDSRLNISQIVDEVSTISPWSHGDAAWQELVACVAEVFAPYDLIVTDSDPGANVSHNEAIVAGFAQEIGGSGFLGIAPSRCLAYNNAISFTFANQFGNDPIDICHTVAQEAAHAFGLEHSYSCSDPMTYLPACGRQFFRDVATTCGDFDELEECRCGGSLQNTHQRLMNTLGPNITAVPGPAIAILRPSEGDVVSDGFAVEFNATHMRGIGTVSLYLNGSAYEEQPGHPSTLSSPYTLTVPSDLPDGIIDVEIRATSDLGAESSSVVTVQKGAPCENESSCYDGQLCEEGRCKFPPADGKLGDTCAADMQCLSGLCSIGSNASYCSKPCFPTNTENTCPSDYKCVEVAPNSGHCRPSGGCGCQSSSGNSIGGIFLLLLVVLRMRRASTRS